MFFLVNLLLCVTYAASCPGKDIPPCTCTSIGDFTNRITCYNAENDDELKISFMNYRKTPIHTLIISNSFLSYIPSDTFKSSPFEMLRITNSTMMSLTDTDVAFEGLESSLRTLIIEDSDILHGLEWAHMRKLKALIEIQTKNIGLEAVDEAFPEIEGLDKLAILNMVEDSISYIPDTGFAALKSLKTLSLKQNKISILKRSMFANPSNGLKSFVLSGNEIQILPKDIFTGMPNLKYLYLEDNKILSLDEQTFAPLKDSLDSLYLSGNPLECDCRMTWILHGKLPTETEGQCHKPPKLKAKSITKLTASDLICYSDIKLLH